jgi:hypothetical protein
MVWPSSAVGDGGTVQVAEISPYAVLVAVFPSSIQLCLIDGGSSFAVSAVTSFPVGE